MSGIEDFHRKLWPERKPVIGVIHLLADIQGIRADGLFDLLAVPVWIVIFDIAQVIEGAVPQFIRDIVSHHPGPLEGETDMHSVEWDRITAAPPVWETAVPILEFGEFGQIPDDGCIHFFRRRQPFSLECSEYIAQGSNCQDAGSKLFGAVEGIGDQVQNRIGQGLQGGR